MLFGQPRSSGYDVNGMTSFRDCFLLIKRDDGEVGTYLRIADTVTALVGEFLHSEEQERFLQIAGIGIDSMVGHA